MLWDNRFKVLRLEGEGSRKFLHGQTSADILKANEDLPIKACCLSTSGKIRCILELILTSKGAEICILAGDFNDIFEGFDNRIFPSDKVQIKGFKEIRRVQEINNQVSWKKSKVIWLDIQDQLPDEFRNSNIPTPEEFRIWSIRQGLPIFNGDINSYQSPFHIGLYDLIDTNKGCYLGQESVARYLRSGVNKKLRFWESENIIKKGDKLTQYSTNGLKDNTYYAGLITSSFDLGNSRSMGLAIIKNKFLGQDDFLINSAEKRIFIKKPLGFEDIPNLDKD